MPQQSHYPAEQRRASHAHHRASQPKRLTACGLPPQLTALAALALAGLVTAAAPNAYALATSLVTLKRCATAYLRHVDAGLPVN